MRFKKALIRPLITKKPKKKFKPNKEFDPEKEYKSNITKIFASGSNPKPSGPKKYSAYKSKKDLLKAIKYISFFSFDINRILKDDLCDEEVLEAIVNSVIYDIVYYSKISIYRLINVRTIYLLLTDPRITKELFNKLIFSIPKRFITFNFVSTFMDHKFMTNKEQFVKDCMDNINFSYKEKTYLIKKLQISKL